MELILCVSVCLYLCFNYVCLFKYYGNGGGGFQISRQKAFRMCNVQRDWCYDLRGDGRVSNFQKKLYLSLEWCLCVIQIQLVYKHNITQV